jgi:hypothetical protein
MPEEYNALGKFANLAEGTFIEKQRERIDQEQAELEAFKATVPEHMFRTSIPELNLSEDITSAIVPLKNAGEAMISLLMDEEKVRSLLDELESPEDALVEIQAALDEIMLFDSELAMIEDLELPAPEASLESTLDEVPEVEAPVAIAEQSVEAVAVVEEIAPVADEEQIEEDIIRDAFGGETYKEDVDAVEDHEEFVVDPIVPEEQPKRLRKPKDEPVIEVEDEVFDDVDIFDDETTDEQRKKEKAKQKRRQLIYDEEKGKMVAKRRRKGNRKSSDFDEWEF